MPNLMGLDIGTTGCKAIVFDGSGRVLARSMREYNVDIPYPNWAEQDAERVWLLAKEAMREVVTAPAVAGNVAAVGLSVQGEAVIPVDRSGRALRPAILGMDTRTEKQNQWLAERFGRQTLFDLTGMPVHTINTLPKLLWIKEIEPEIWEKANRFLLYEDYIIFQMTGKALISRCLASRTQLYDARQGAWSQTILSAIELEEDRLAPIQESGAAAGQMHALLSRELGFNQPPVIVNGGHDQACGALGVGNVEPGQASVSSGTAEVVEVTMAGPVLNEGLFQGNISIYAHVAENRHVAMTLNHSGGILLRWFRDTFGQEEMDRAAKLGKDPYDLILAGAGPEPTGLLVLPHFSGSGTPIFDTSSKGCILGLTLNTGKKDLLKAIIEGLTYELRVNTDLLRQNGIPMNELRAIGGGAKSDLWLQMKADICQVPVVRPEIFDAACWGAAVLAGKGAGLIENAAQAAAASVKIISRFEPDAARVRIFEDQFKLYQEVYPAVRAIQSRLAC